LSIRRSQIAIIVLLVANLAGCSFAAYGAGIFCLASKYRVEWFTYPQFAFLVLTIPVLAVGLFWSRIRLFAAVIGMLCLIGLAAQQVLLERDVLYCDAP
jgi:hypothetical protein